MSQVATTENSASQYSHSAHIPTGRSPSSFGKSENKHIRQRELPLCLPVVLSRLARCPSPRDLSRTNPVRCPLTQCPPQHRSRYKRHLGAVSRWLDRTRFPIRNQRLPWTRR